MGQQGRVANSTKNLIYGFLSQFIVLVLNFIVRIVFVRCLGETYLGVNGLFSNILSVLSLAEMGFGTAVTYSLYKPLAEHDQTKINSLMRFYSKVYKGVGLFVGIAGLSILPFLKILIKDTNGIQNLHIIYILFLADSVGSYFFAYRKTLLNADQKAYICSRYRFVFIFFRGLFQCILLIVFRQFLLYLLTQIVFTFGENLYISKKTAKMYPYLNERDAEKLDEQSVKRIKKDVSALMLSKISSVALHGTDNIIISSFVGINNVGILSNYTLISGSLTMVLSQVSSAIIGSLGNFIASEGKTKHMEMFKKIDFMYFAMYGFCFVCMFSLYNPFISIFFGKEYVFETAIVLVFCLNYLIEGMLQSFWNFRTTMGLFVQGKYRPVFAAIINIVMSIFLANKLGVFGVLAGTTISRLFVNAWYDPYIIYKYGLRCSPLKYYLSYVFKICLLGVLVVIITGFKRCFFPSEYTIGSFFVLCAITVVIAVVGIALPYCRTEEFKYFWTIAKNVLCGLKRNIKS